MKKKLSQIAPILVCALLVASLSLMFFKTIGVTTVVLLTFVWSLLFVLIFYLIFVNKKLSIVVFSIILVALPIVFFLLDATVQSEVLNFFNASKQFLFDNAPLSLEYTNLLCILSILIISLIIYIPTLAFSFFPATLIICITLVILQWDQRGLSILYETSIVFGCLLVFFAHGLKPKPGENIKTVRNLNSAWLIPVAALLVIMLVSLANGKKLDSKWEWLSLRTNIIGDYISEFTGNTRERTIFNISSVGYQPLNNRLGGPVELSDKEIMYVQTDRPVLLIGNIKNTYTGNSWIDDSDSYRYRFNLKNENVKDQVFSLYLPQGDARNPLFFRKVDVSISPISNGSSTLFTPFRTMKVSADKMLTMIPSFNTIGEVFSSRNIESGIGYKIKVDFLLYEAASFENYVKKVQSNLSDDYSNQRELIDRNFTKVAENIPASVHETVLKITEDVESDYLKAVAIMEYLEDGFTYTLSPDIPPEDMGFVEHFLETKRGYCTYFASAMAVMARSAGIPSRYVEGFRTDPKAQPHLPQVITGKNAHAWAEVYIEGFGWIPFEPETRTNNQIVSSGETIPFEEEFFNEEFVEEVDVPIEQPTTSMPIVAIIITISTIVLLFAALLVISRIRLSLFAVKKRYKNNNEIVVFYYKTILKLFSYYKYDKPPGTTLNAHAIMVDEWLNLYGYKYQKVAEVISKMIYAQQDLTDKDMLSIFTYHKALLVYSRRKLGIFKYIDFLLKSFFNSLRHRPATQN
ncbi:MAG: transglutaminase domain-containing protein [Clostridiales bacterium]|nr:transglutaminase domain-containing protein [Clostridiales bacterium]